MNKVCVTGGAGFIGSHLVDALIKRGCTVIVLDNISTGRLQNTNENAINLKVDFTDVNTGDLAELIRDCDTMFHFQANADVRGGEKNSYIDFQQNIFATQTILMACKMAEVKKFAFASSATVYGEPTVIPTPETYCGVQTSHYGASKSACEKMIEGFTSYTNMRAASFRFPSVIGERYSHGIIIDMFRKMTEDPFEVEVLGDGRQGKAYIHVSDVVRGVITAMEKLETRYENFNVSNNLWLPVSDVVQIIANEMGLPTMCFRYTGGKRGWIGDSPLVVLDSKKLQALGWTQEISIIEGIKRTIAYLKANQ
jgi:UDP-glucose 4-epimerase